MQNGHSISLFSLPLQVPCALLNISLKPLGDWEWGPSKEKGEIECELVSE